MGVDCPSCGASNAAGDSICSQCGAALAQVPEVRPGFLLGGRYVIEKALGRGGMGVVYKAHDRLLNETVAIKLLRPDVASTAEAALRFISEIKLARSISHRNVGRIHEYGEDRGLRYISMAYVDGIDLKRLIRNRGRLPPAEAYEIAISVAEALDAIHHEGIVHRDLKAPNVMIDGRGVARLMDFGIAKHWASETDGVTGTGQIIGTPEYMSPEQIRGQPVDARSDLYALGILVYELFTGTTPFHAETPMAVVMKHLSESPRLDGPEASSLPSALLPVLRTALSKERESRFGSAREFVQALERARGAPHTGPTFVPAPPSTREAAPPTTLLPWSDDAPPTVPHGVEGRASRPQTPTVKSLSGRGGSRPGRVAALAVPAILALAAATWWMQRPDEESAAPEAHIAQAEVDPSPAAPAPPISTTPGPLVSEGPPVTETTIVPAPPRLRAPDTRPRMASPAPPEPRAMPTTAPKPVEAAPARTAEIDRFVADAERALTSQDYDAAIALYDQAIKLDPLHQIARMGRATAVNAKVTAQALAPLPRPAGLSFAVGTTQTQSVENRPDTAFAEGFQTSPDLAVTRDTTAAATPARIEFQMKPDRIQAGDRYELNAFLVNAGAQPIQIKEMVVTSVVNGKRVAGPVPLVTRTAAPGSRTLLLQVSESLPPSLKDWSVDLVVRSTRGDTYRNRIAVQ